MRLILTLVLAALPLLILADDPPYTVHCTDENQTWCANCNPTSGKDPWERPSNEKYCPVFCSCSLPVKPPN
ncbi:hypothetical protein PGT21_032962 [Puccinia graminis f. sp. tritici]|uniref:Uncharacterized protein n=1 Tax=Puccinia graminis f. sp. tritici TaxID=56615 RepID=A0A5B0S4X7_PUCGR|nr:hypothetical protein PGT21_032962 [Puccinia graminis f. sp. tritici]KAA1133181.1 hypothetical protein PGTUg99_024626 [Puccinia graminis f. sp. tritici]